tara:strand:- start:867 stop:1100 length:234 start_codon:yes stop_codon:yes gene_type:complete
MSIDNTNYSGPDHLMDMAKISCEEIYPESEAFASGNLLDIETVDSIQDEEWSDHFYTDIPSACGVNDILMSEYGTAD